MSWGKLTLFALVLLASGSIIEYLARFIEGVASLLAR